MVSNPDGKQLSEMAMAAAQRGQLAEAAQGFDRSARAHLAARQTGAAFAALSNLAMILKLMGDLRGALAALNEALNLPAAPQERGIALMTRGSILDALNDPSAVTAWMEAAAQLPTLAQAAFCRAHAAGAGLKHGAPTALTDARNAVAGAGQVSPSLLVGLVGAVGESGGAAGVPMLAQAVLLMRRRIDAWNPSTAPFWNLLIERVGPGTPLALALCSFGLILTSMRSGQPDHPVLMSRIGAVLDRCARARGTDVDQLLSMIQASPGAFEEIEPALRSIIPPGSWLVSL
jgi:tetratricopeptide (TPR) repeat protein